jgi:hypothetical protein
LLDTYGRNTSDLFQNPRQAGLEVITRSQHPRLARVIRLASCDERLAINTFIRKARQRLGQYLHLCGSDLFVPESFCPRDVCSAIRLTPGNPTMVPEE